MSALPDFAFVATPESLAQWLIGRDGVLVPPPAAGTPIPLSYFFFLRMQPLTGTSIHAALGRDPDRGLYGGVSYRALRPLCVGDRFDATCRVVETREVASPRGTLVLRTLETRYAVAGDTALTERVRTVDIPPGPPVPPPAGLRRSPGFPRIARVPSATATAIAWTMVATGDLNPLHLDPEYAARRGYPGVVVPGTLIAARVEASIAAHRGRPLTTLELRLHAPSFRGELWDLHLADAGGQDGFELFSDGTLRADGRAS